MNENYKRESIEFLKDIVDIKTVNGTDDEGNLAEFISNYFKKHNIDSWVDRIDNKHANVYATIKGKRNNPILWNGHLDTVPYGDLDNWTVNPQVHTLDNQGRIFGRGTSDMKSGLAAMVFTLANIDFVPENTIYFAGTCDEESNGVGAKRIVEKKLFEDCDKMIIAEPTSMNIGVAQKGCVWLEVNVRGKTAHSAYPEKGINAIECGIMIFLEIKKYLNSYYNRILGKPTIQLNVINGGNRTNMVSDTAKLIFDIRYIPEIKINEFKGIVDGIVSDLIKKKKGLSITLKWKNERRSFEISKDSSFYQVIKDTMKECNVNNMDIGINFFTDASIIAEEGSNKEVILLGPGEPEMAHKPDEFMYLDKYIDAIKVFNRILKKQF